MLFNKRIENSTHALREESDVQDCSRGGAYHNKFLSTPSARRATIAAVVYVVYISFLSTPSVRRATTQHWGAVVWMEISIHALREEGDTVFSISASFPEHFYPRPPRGGRQSTRPFSTRTF